MLSHNLPQCLQNQQLPQGFMGLVAVACQVGLCDTHQAQYAAASAEGSTNKQTMHASSIAYTCLMAWAFLSVGSIYGVYVWAIIRQDDCRAQQQPLLPQKCLSELLGMHM